MSDAPLRSRSRWLVWALSALLLTGCAEKTADRPHVSEDPGPVHVHGLGVNPTDGALFVATHTGLFRAAQGELRSRRVADRYQDTMGFTVVGADRFLGSGHPDLRERRSPFLGLIESSDAGRTWRAVSLDGKADFHVLEASGRRVYGYGSDFETRDERLMTSTDGGRDWKRLDAPAALISLAISPSDPRRVVASGERRAFGSRDGGRSWSDLDAPAAGLLAWTNSGLFLVDLEGRVWRRAGTSAPWRSTGGVGAAPAAFDSGSDDDLLVALHDGTIMRSADDGRTWSVRSRP
ncbi:MAG: exo-alpha-sialidase [Solirubrobacterales bacterium]|nr:exo-alpha-sialidase [Solirubrobacterales bacterium]